MLFLSVFATIALSTSLANALPSSGPIEGGLEARHTCGKNEFWYSRKSCCVKDGGDTPGTPGYVLLFCLGLSQRAEMSPQKGPILPSELLLAQKL